MKSDKTKTNSKMSLIPKISKSENKLKFNFPNLQIACVEYIDGPVGCSLFYFSEEVLTFADIRGGWPGTINCRLSNTEESKAHGICFAGGSLMGLEAITGTIKGVFEDKFRPEYIAGAIIYSGNLQYNKIYPDVKLGEFAYNNMSKGLFPLGQVGAGASAGGGRYGQGASYRELSNGVKILFFVILNAVGDIYDKEGKLFRDKNKVKLKKGQNTTLSLLVTDANVSYHHLEQLGKQVHTSMSRAIKPFNTLFDGDSLFAVSTQKNKAKFTRKEWYEFTQECEDIAWDAILSACQ
jgi:6-aminohexanoate-oligomer endohydrolase